MLSSLLDLPDEPEIPNLESKALLRIRDMDDICDGICKGDESGTQQEQRLDTQGFVAEFIYALNHNDDCELGLLVRDRLMGWARQRVRDGL